TNDSITRLRSSYFYCHYSDRCPLHDAFHSLFFFFFFNAPATTEIYTLSLHDALPISWSALVPVMIRRSLNSSARGIFSGRKNHERIGESRSLSTNQSMSYPRALKCLRSPRMAFAPATWG